MRKEFALPETDVQYLDTSGLQWETVRDQGAFWLIVYARPVPSGYNVAQVATALMIPPGYPDAAIDMVYFFPDLHRVDGVAIGALAPHQLDGKQWQRWSRHRTQENPWRPGEDDIAVQMTLVDHWLQREFSKPKP